jgi:hypothetical protein
MTASAADQLRQVVSAANWERGDLVAELYGENTLARFTAGTRVNPKTLYSLRQVGRPYPENSRRGENFLVGAQCARQPPQPGGPDVQGAPGVLPA